MPKKQIITLLVAFVLITSIFIIYYLVVINKVPEWSTRGQIGDTFGAPNAFLSGLAMLGALYAILQQNEVIRQSKVESENSIKEFKESVSQFQQQQKIQALTTLITIYEKQVDYYKKNNEPTLYVQSNKKLFDYTSELENLLTKI
jgi:hypothetical protein